MCHAVYIANDNVLEVSEVIDSITGNIDTGASVSVELVTLDGVHVAGESWPLIVPHSADGLYRVTLSHALELKQARPVIAQIRITGSTGAKAYWQCKVLPKVRGCQCAE